MNVSTITMDEADARVKLDEYRAGLALRDDEEYERLVKAYAALAKGTPLLVLSQVIANAPRDERLRPRLAIARADRRQVQYRRDRRQPFEVFTTNLDWHPHASRGTELTVPSIEGVTPAYPATLYPEKPWRDSVLEGFSIVPIVPPAVRGRRALNKHFVLWEVEQWANTVIRASPDRDPYLLAQITDDLFAVVGEWDLTDIERAVLADRRRG